jgi:heme o synthase
VTVESTRALSTRSAAIKRRLADYVDLSKPRILTLSLITVWGSMSVAAAGHWPSAGVIFAAFAGVALAVAAGGSLNFFIERKHDARMVRTAHRPLPSGRLYPREVLVLGTALWIASYFILFFMVNPITAYLTMIAFGSYVGIYTPLKRLSPWCTVVGAIPGALPPLIGWTAVRGSVDWAGISLFAILFVWQIPHFLSLAILRRDEYAQAGMPMMPVVYGPRPTLLVIVLTSIALVPVSLLPFALNIAGPVFAAVALVLGIAFTAYAAFGYVEQANNAWCRRFFRFSVIYLGVLFAALVVGA